MKLYTLEQLEVLMLVAGSEQPMETAQKAHRRWTHVLEEAKAAQERLALTPTFSQDVKACDAFADRAKQAVAVLDEWLSEHAPHHGKTVDGL